MIILNRPSILHGFRYMEPQKILGHDDLLGSHDVIGHVTLDSQYTVSYSWYSCSFGTNPISRIVAEIFHSHWKHIDPFLCFRGKIGCCSIFQHWAYGGPRHASCEPLTAAIGHGPRHGGVRTFSLKCITGMEKRGKIGENTDFCP